MGVIHPRGGGVAHCVVLEKHARSDVGVFAADHIDGKAADGLQCAASVDAKRVGAEAGLDAQLRRIGQALAATLGRVVEMPRLRAQHTGAGVWQLPAVRHAAARVLLQFVKQVGEGLGAVGDRVLSHHDQRITTHLFTGPAARAAVVEVPRVDHLDPGAEVAKPRHGVIAGGAVDHQHFVRLQGLHFQRRQQARQVTGRVAGRDDQRSTHVTFSRQGAHARRCRQSARCRPRPGTHRFAPQSSPGR